VTSQREIEGTVVETLPKGLYRVRGDDGKVVTASLGGMTRNVTVKVIPGDRVLIEVSQFDPARGRIKTRRK
jgi:translation initiation factor IF-1